MSKCKNVECNNETEGKKLYCSLNCRSYYVNKYVRDYSKMHNTLKTKQVQQEKEYYLNPNKCLKCEENIPFKSEGEKFCSHSCSASYNNKNRLHTNDSKIKRSNTIKSKIFSGEIIPHREGGKQITYCTLKYNNCVVCNSIIIQPTHKKKKTCSKECRNKWTSICSTNNPNCGGETNFRRYTYKDIIFDSSWEVEVAKLLDSLNIIWQRSRKIMFYWIDLENKKRRYYPDFYLPQYNIYLDPKNLYKMKQDEYKINSVINLNKINLIVGDKNFILNFINKLAS